MTQSLEFSDLIYVKVLFRFQGETDNDRPKKNSHINRIFLEANANRPNKLIIYVAIMAYNQADINVNNNEPNK